MNTDETHQTDARKVRVTITLDEHVYRRIKEVSRDMGLRPSTWMTMVCTSKANNVILETNHNGR